MKCGIGPSDGILGITSTWRLHFVKSGNAISGFELGHIITNGVHYTSDIITLVCGGASPLWVLVKS